MKLKLNFIYAIVFCSMIHLYSGMAEKFLGCCRFSMTNDSGSFTPEFKLIGGLVSILPTIIGVVSTILWNKKQLDKQYNESELEKFWLEEKQCLKSKILLDPITLKRKIQWENQQKAEFFLSSIGMEFDTKKTYDIDIIYGFSPNQRLHLLADSNLYYALLELKIDQFREDKWHHYTYLNKDYISCQYNGENNKDIFRLFEKEYENISLLFKDNLNIILPQCKGAVLVDHKLFIEELINAIEKIKQESPSEALDLCRSMLSLCNSPIRSLQYIAQNINIIRNIKNNRNEFLKNNYQPYIIKKLQENSKVESINKVEWINMVPFLGLFSSLEKPNSLLLAANVLSTLSIFCLSFAWLLCDSNKAESFNMLSIYLITFCISMLHAIHHKKF